MRRIIFIALIIFLNIFGAHSSSVIAAMQGQMNIDAYVDPRLSGIGGGAAMIYDTAPPVISDVQISEITTHSAKVSWKTNENGSAYLYYGKTPSYKIGILQDHPESIGFFHKIAISGLKEETKYYFQLRSLDSAGNQGIKDGYEFTTLPGLKGTSNVSLFAAQSVEGKIILNWSNPSSENFAGVQINKNVGSPVLDPQSGEIIYSGAEESFDDTNIENEARYFYTAFSYDGAGNFSSGAIASAIGIKTAEIKPPILPKPPLPPATPPSDVKNLQTVPDAKNKKIIIKWANPEEEGFEEVEIRKSKEFPALNPGEGELIYKGKESGFEDANVEEGAVYYYTAFTIDKAGNYSSGVAASGTLKKLPPSLISEISIDDASFILSEESLLLPKRGDKKVYTFPNKEINIYYDSKNLPETLKTIIITVGRSSYILSSDKDNKFYRAKFISPGDSGNYPLTISVLDFRAGKIFQAKAEMVVEDYGRIYECRWHYGSTAPRDYGASSCESKNFFEKIVSSIKYQVFLIIKDTKRPIGRLVSAPDLEKIGVERASVALYEFSEENNSWQLWPASEYNQKNPQLTGERGAFGFIVPSGKYKILVQKDGYNSMEGTIDVQNNLINGEIEIKKKADWRWMILLLAALWIAVAGLRRLRKKRKKQTNIQ